MPTGSILFPDCESASSLGITVIATALVSIIENSLPLYILMQFSSEEGNMAIKGFIMTVRIYLLALVATDILGSMLVIPMLLITEFNNVSCLSNFMKYFGSKGFCRFTYGSYFAYKLTSMFLVTFTGYYCFLHYNQNTKHHFHGGTIDRKSCACENQVSLTTAASTQTNQSQSGREKERAIKHIPRRATMSFMIILIIALSFFIAALPSMGLGPSNGTSKMDLNPTVPNASFAKKSDSPSVSPIRCTLHSFGRPQVEKEYIFLFSILMASGGCSLILIYIFLALFGGRFRSCHNIFMEMAQFVTAQGFLFLATWMPILVSICFAMSGKRVSEQIQLYLTLITFINCLSHPFLYGYCLSMVRNGYRRILTRFISSMKCCFHRKDSEDTAGSTRPKDLYLKSPTAKTNGTNV